ncbi:response regulator [uncultured Albimonas sp.]|uniref:response regulator n=1 Tax=uncultured Albimonas sp. TaxID=1331701 RepID=UPI0030EBA54A
MTSLPLIAIVDDDAPFLRAMESLVRALGWRAAGFDSAERFLASAERREAACVVSDLQMPGMGGLALLAALRAQGARPPVILVTARSEPRLAAEALAGGALRLLRKPVEPGELIDCIARALAARPV